MDTAVKEKKPYKIKKNWSTSKFEILNPETDELLEGFEDKAFGSPIEAGRFMSSILKAVDKTVAETVKKETTPPNEGFEIPIIEGREPVIEVIGKQRYFEVVLHEQDNMKRTNVFLNDGYNTDFLVVLDKPVILPEGAVNVAKEAVYTLIESHYDAKEGKAWDTTRDIPRFSVSILREVPYDEAKAWLSEQKKISRRF